MWCEFTELDQNVSETITTSEKKTCVTEWLPSGLDTCLPLSLCLLCVRCTPVLLDGAVLETAVQRRGAAQRKERHPESEVACQRRDLRTGERHLHSPDINSVLETTMTVTLLKRKRTFGMGMG